MTTYYVPLVILTRGSVATVVQPHHDLGKISFGGMFPGVFGILPVFDNYDDAVTAFPECEIKEFTGVFEGVEA